MLGLKLSTDPRWVNLASMNIEDILTDHAYCEQKAASTCISLIQLYPDRDYLVDKVAPVVTEEWMHFRMVLTELKKRDLKLGKQRKDEYVLHLQDFTIKGGSVEDKFVDRMLMAALIEARSCERFRLLSEEITDESLREFYRKLMIAEANHYTMFIEIATYYAGKEKVKKRWDEWINFEAKVMKSLELRGDRMH
jgi:tRNA-(ms[2]io[6]A)-hydroxylase